MNRVFCLTIFLFTLLAAKPSSAAILRALSIEELSAKSDVIVHGKVLSKTCQRDAEGRIFTSVELEVTEVWKGNIASNRFTIVHSGGVLGEEVQQSDVQVRYDINEEVVAFLRLNPQGVGVTLGLVQGKFHVWTDDQSRAKFVRNIFHGSDKPSTAPPGKQAIAPPEISQPLSLAELKQRAQGGVR